MSYVTILEDSLNKLKYSNALGPDGIPSSIVKPSANLQCHILPRIVNLSLITSVLSRIWKNSFLILINKNSSRRLVENYKSIAKLSVFPKLFGRIVAAYFSFANKSFICPYQLTITVGFLSRFIKMAVDT